MTKGNETYNGDGGLSGFRIVRWCLQAKGKTLQKAIEEVESIYSKRSVEVITKDVGEGQAGLHYLMGQHDFEKAKNLARRLEKTGMELLLTQKIIGGSYTDIQRYPERNIDDGTTNAQEEGTLEGLLHWGKERHRREPLTYTHLSQLLAAKGIPTINDPEEYVVDDLGNLARTSLVSGTLVYLTTPGPLTLQEIHTGLEKTLQPFGIEMDELETQKILTGLTDVELIRSSNKKPPSYSFNPIYLQLERQ